MAEHDPWELGSGLALDGATVEVKELEFGFNANIGAGIVCANFVFEDVDGGEEPIEQSFSVGGKFEANRDGSAIEGPGKINRNSNYGLLLASVADVLGNPGEVIPEPREAAHWIGTRWTFGSVTRETQNPTTGVKKESTAFVVTEYHGRADDAGTTKKATAKKAAGTAKKATAKKAAEPDIDPELWDQLLALAAEHDDQGEFAAAALELPEVENNKAAQKAVMSTKPGGIWQARLEAAED